MDESPPRSRHPDSLAKAFLWVLFPMLALFLIPPSVGNTQVPVVTDITSSGLGTEVPLQPPSDGVYDIIGGTRPGGGLNLFHSFGDFSIGQGDIANFLNDSGLTTSNIIGRVTGGNISNIDGIIQTTGFGNANLFLVNPSGIVFGPHGSFNVGGSVSFATAQYLRLFDGVNSANFYASPANDGLANSVFAMAPVADFGFLSPAAYGFLTAPDPSATITVQGSALRVPIIIDSETGQPKGSTLSLVGGDINIIADPDTGTPAALTAPSGQINLVSVTSPGEILFQGLTTGPNVNGATVTTMGTVTIKEGAMLDVSGQLDEFGTPIGNGNSGTVFVRGGQLVMHDSTILAMTVGAVDGANTAVDIQVSQGVTLTNGSIQTITSGTGKGGDVQLTTRTLTIENAPQSILTATIDGNGVGGDVVLNVEKLSLMGGSQILSISQTLVPESGAGLSPGLGHGGNVTIQGLQGVGSAAKSVDLAGDSSLLSLTAGGPGQGGEVAITAKSLTMDGAATGISSSAAGLGRGGDIVVGVQQAILSGGAFISAQIDTSESSAQVGATVTVQGLQGAGSMADSVALSGFGSRIVTDTIGQGQTGDVAVHAKTVSLTDRAVIQAGTPSTPGAGGNVTIVASSINISGGSRISSQASEVSAGQVTITANKLTLDDGSIATSTSSSTGGRGGDVVMEVRGAVSLSNGAGINSSTSGTGQAGDITMNVVSLTLADHSEITSSSTGTVADAGDAGNITIQSGSTVVLNHSSITTEAREASGGQIEINAPEMVQLINSQVSTSVKDGTGGGGNITIDPQFVILQNSQIIAQAFAGAGGAIEIVATSAFIADPNSIVDASSTLGISGIVNIQSPLQNVGGELPALSEEFSSAAALLAQQCAARVADGKFSTFVIAGREGLPVEPGGFLASPSLTAELLGSRFSERDSHSQLSAVTGLFPKYDARPIQLAKLGNTCR